MRPASRTGSTTRRRMPRLRSIQPSRSRASNGGIDAPRGSPPTPAPAARRTPRNVHIASSFLSGYEVARCDAAVGRTRARKADFEVLVDVRPVAISLEDDLAAVAAKHDLNVPTPNCLGVAAADGAGGGLFHVHRRNRVDLDL